MFSNIPSWQILTAHAQLFRGARDLAFCLKVPLDSLLVWASSEGSGETARMRRLAWTFAARICDKHQNRLTRSTLFRVLTWLVPNKTVIVTHLFNFISSLCRFRGVYLNLLIKTFPFLKLNQKFLFFVCSIINAWTCMPDPSSTVDWTLEL